MGVSLKVVAEVTSQSETAAKVTATVWAVSNYGSYNNDKQSGTVTINGTKYSFSSAYKSNQKTKIAEKSKTIEKTTTSQKIAVSASFNSGTSSGKVSGSDSVVVKALRSYTVSYSASGATNIPSKQTKWYGKPLTLSSKTPKKTGYSFLRWHGSNNINYSPSAKYSGNAGLTLTAVWQTDTFQITFKDGATTLGNPVTVEKGTYTISSLKPSPSKTGYKFLGWSDTNNNVKKYSAGQSIEVSSNMTLYTVYQAVRQTTYDGPELFVKESFRCSSSGHESLNGHSYKIVLTWSDSAITTSQGLTTGAYRLWMTINEELFEQGNNNDFIVAASTDVTWGTDTNASFFYPTTTAINNKTIELIIQPNTNFDSEGFSIDDTYDIVIYMLDIKNTSYSTSDSDGGSSTIAIPEEDRTDQVTATVAKGGYIMHFSPEQRSAGIFSIADTEKTIQIYDKNFQLNHNGNITISNAIKAKSGTILDAFNVNGKLSAGCLNGNLFTMTSNSVTFTCGPGGLPGQDGAGTRDLSVPGPSGYFPIAVSSVNVTSDGVSSATAPTWLNVYAYFFKSRGNGTSTVRFKYRNTHNSADFHAKVVIYVLWFKAYLS